MQEADTDPVVRDDILWRKQHVPTRHRAPDVGGIHLTETRPLLSKNDSRDGGVHTDKTGSDKNGSRCSREVSVDWGDWGRLWGGGGIDYGGNNRGLQSRKRSEVGKSEPK